MAKAKTIGDIACKVHLIYELARISDTPLSVLNMHGTILLANRDWDVKEVERVNREVLEMLVTNGALRIGNT